MQFLCIFLKEDLYNAHKEIPFSRLTSNSDGGTGKVFSYVTGPLDYGRKYAIRLVAVNTNGLVGNMIISRTHLF